MTYEVRKLRRGRSPFWSVIGKDGMPAVEDETVLLVRRPSESRQATVAIMGSDNPGAQRLAMLPC